MNYFVEGLQGSGKSTILRSKAYTDDSIQQHLMKDPKNHANDFHG